MAWVVVDVCVAQFQGSSGLSFKISFFFFFFIVVLPSQHYSSLFVILECVRPQKISFFFFLFSVQHFITVCNIVCANGGNICISIKYMITIWKHVAEFHVYFS